MPRVEFGPWLPDNTDIGGQPHLVDAQGCLPVIDHYRPLPGLTAGPWTGCRDTRDPAAASPTLLRSGRNVYATDGAAGSGRPTRRTAVVEIAGSKTCNRLTAES